MKNLREKIKKAVDVTQRAQRNYDLSKEILNDDLATLIYAASNSPSKQNETHYDLYVFTDKQLIRKIYEETKLFLLMQQNETEDIYGEKNGEFWQSDERSVHNSQVLANALFVYFEHRGDPRGGTHAQAHKGEENFDSELKYHTQIGYSIGVSSGQLTLSAALMGYKTGYCSAFFKGPVKKICNTERMPKLLVGIGFENPDLDRRMHAETCNRDIPNGFRTGSSDEKWRFPSFDKNIQVYLNNSIYNCQNKS